MIYKNVELHNVAEVSEIQGRQGVLLQRIPQELSEKIRPGTQGAYLSAAGVEIRFACDWEPVKVTLVCYGETKAKAQLFYGDFQAGQFEIGEQATVIEIPAPNFLKNNQIDKFKFNPIVTRLLLSGKNVHFISIEGSSIRPPEKSEVPALRYLAYGTSITQGIAATTPALTFVNQVGWRLGADALNMGVGGNAFCERELADYLAAREDWDLATYCLSTNMMNQGVHVDEFYKKAEYMVKTAAQKNPGKPVICISVFPSSLDKGIMRPRQKPLSTPQEYRHALKSIVNESGLDNLYFIDGTDLLLNYTGLAYDLLHPGDYGMIEIAESLAAFIKPLLKR